MLLAKIMINYTKGYNLTIKHLKAQFLKGRDEVNRRNFFNGVLQDVPAAELRRAKVAFSSVVEALNEGASKVSFYSLSHLTIHVKITHTILHSFNH